MDNFLLIITVQIFRQYFSECNKAKQEATETQRRCDEFISALANKASVNVAGKVDPMDYIVSVVSVLGICFLPLL